MVIISRVTFKPLQALIGLQEGVITAGSTFSCNLGIMQAAYTLAAMIKEPLDLVEGLQHSCNAYFCNVFRNIIENRNYKNTSEAYSAWRDYVLAFGFGEKLNSDFTNELKGFIALPDYYDRYYGQNRWSALTVISLSIGQGEILATPLQIANLAASIANRGYYFTPHSIKHIDGVIP
jgi:penicillin-binding protein 2